MKIQYEYSLKLLDINQDKVVISDNNFSIQWEKISCERSKNNIENRCLHQHVFNANSALEIVEYIGLNILYFKVENDCDSFILAQKIRKHQHIPSF